MFDRFAKFYPGQRVRFDWDDSPTGEVTGTRIACDIDYTQVRWDDGREVWYRTKELTTAEVSA